MAFVRRPPLIAFASLQAIEPALVAGVFMLVQSAVAIWFAYRLSREERAERRRERERERRRERRRARS